MPEVDLQEMHRLHFHVEWSKLSERPKRAIEAEYQSITLSPSLWQHVGCAVCRDIELSRSLSGAVTYSVATPSFRSAAFHSLVSLLIYTLPVRSRALRALINCHRGL
jgi:hypothetical protein